MKTLLITLLQSPTSTPNPGDANTLDLSNPFELIVYIICPIAILIFYFLYRKQNRNNK